jgi:FkbM family methyltransferase
MFAPTRLVGRAVRLPLRLLPSGMVVPILRGPLAGKRWTVGAGTHGCWLGTYEYSTQRRFAAAARSATVVFDVGANVGFYTLLAAVAMGPSGRVVAFEPLPRNLAHLRAHVRLNALPNVEVRACAVADASGTAAFLEGPNPSMGALADGGEVQVMVVAIDELTAAGSLPNPDLMKIDVEGAEARVLDGAAATIARARPLIFLSTHGEELHAHCARWLSARGYAVDALGPGELLARPASGPRTH